jgi:predicted acetyltransferase
MLIIRLPTLDDTAAFNTAISQISPDNPSFLHHYQAGMSLADYLDVLGGYRQGKVALALDVVPTTFLFAFLDTDIVGRISIRHRLMPRLPNMTGHIGYAVLPPFRGRGFATEMLRFAVQYARHTLEINRLSVTCEVANLASIRVIEKNGGVLESIEHDARQAVANRCYWIDPDGRLDYQGASE